MHTLALVATALFSDRFLWPFGFPVRIEQLGGKSVGVDVNFGLARPDLVDTFMKQWPHEWKLRPSGKHPEQRELWTRVEVADVGVDLTVLIHVDLLPHLTYQKES